MPRLRSLWATILSALILAIIPMSAGAQSTFNTTYYGYFSPDGSNGVMLGELISNDSTLAGELVSPRYADDFFSGFDIFSGHAFASELPARHIEQVSRADEYMVFKGQLDWFDGNAPGYVIFLSVSSKAFILIGCQRDAEDLFGLAAATVDAGRAPQTYGDFTRVPLSDTGTVSTGSDGEQSESESQSSLNILCHEDPSIAPLDTNGDGLITLPELEEWSLVLPEANEVIANMNANGFDAIQYDDC
jgi:hypothetical protein